MQDRAVIDRIVDETHAVLLVGAKERELVVPVAELPEGVAAGDWLIVYLDGGTITRAALAPDETAERRSLIQEKLDRLRKRGRRL